MLGVRPPFASTAGSQARTRALNHVLLHKSTIYQYMITESPLPVTNYISTIKVVKAKEGSTVVWSSTFIAKQGTADDEAKKVIAGIYTAGLDGLKSKLK